MNDALNMASENDPAFCPNNCGRLYKGMARKYSLKKHLIYACGVNPQFKCKFCQKGFRYNQSLQYHIVSAHRQLNNLI